MKKVAFLFSGRGSLLSSVKNAIENSSNPAELCLIITNNKDFSTKGLSDFDGIKVHKISHLDYSSREGFEQEIADKLEKNESDLIVLGGFRRIFSPEFVKKFGNKTINTHPSLLPAFPGDKAQLRAIESGVRITGATVHFINDEVDAGPIIEQECVRIYNGMTESELREAIINAEKEMMYRVVIAFIDNKLKLENNKVFFEG
ncbi:putative phosphoribosylglycinamide formyltransferase [Xenorhabdus nematophila ATCC 19061]|uniref:Phosphoribosylglycinamide formyltransferase n=1 Tax=Xenorhabdus nematophila (strain ATCC 19061 / DSM 3370 / CCUG 14189 / LMG 1036 / NCIMB 9965 / AN6) TaxID=406817 RepID=D3VDM2_XENNA|nr:phosphoribosylglycinamide formyltransferase [Xenorhabdus nematophila]CBJ92262.1 putative phosphoribosylglycinamide formyltransferase [Xenorhabdus nematophila ATCC 19061]CEK25077.1 putative phosphoribosylglycinamide formyltransferase [Xenorhabdus nematophila AN6/1]